MCGFGYRGLIFYLVAFRAAEDLSLVPWSLSTSGPTAELVCAFISWVLLGS